ncbi:MAG TPA: DUF948 domain-containing protein [Nitrospiraceae bacterium]|jgi:uncharacterized protein YoxC|nr:DUF948 domain-containing protein [Nitrospiraceae bacterium]
MLLEIAGIITALAFAVLVGYVVSTLIQVRKTLVELQIVLVHMNSQLPPLLKDLRLMTENVNALSEQARDGIDHAAVFLHAVGSVGETVEQVHGLVRGQGEGLVSKLFSVVAGVKAASAVVKARFSKSHDEGNGAVPR